MTWSADQIREGMKTEMCKPNSESVFPCPFCATSNSNSMLPLDSHQRLDGRMGFYRRCLNCGTLGPESSSMEEATAKWNCRLWSPKIQCPICDEWFSPQAVDALIIKGDALDVIRCPKCLRRECGPEAAEAADDVNRSVSK